VKIPAAHNFGVPAAERAYRGIAAGARRGTDRAGPPASAGRLGTGRPSRRAPNYRPAGRQRV